MGIPSTSVQGVTSPTMHPTLSMKMNTQATPLPNEYAPVNIEETVNTAQASKPIDPQLAMIAKQRRALQIKEKQILDREKAFASRPPNEGLIDVNRLKTDPLNVLLENGVTYDQLTKAIMGNQQNSEVLALKQKIESLEKGIDQKFSDKDAAAERQVLAEMRREADQLKRSDDFELVRETRSVPLVMKLIERTYREHGEVLDVREAMSLMESELLKDQQRLARSKKLQGMYPQNLQTQQRQGMRTLTNKDTASVPMGAKARAMAAFYGNLKR